MRKNSKKKRSLYNPINLVLVLLVAGLAGWLAYGFYPNTTRDKSSTHVDIPQSQTPQANTQTEKETPKTKLKIFTGEEFKKLYNEFAYPNTQYISENSLITGNSDVDLYIQKYAENRGYQRRSAPIQDVFRTVQEDGVRLQERAYQPWLDLKASAEKENIALYLTAGYRSQSEQREIFLQRFNISQNEYPSILNGSYDNRLNSTLSTAAIPGYSRHHNGYTVDIGCNNQRDRAFEFTVCFEWLSRNNYENAKKHGWIPSYPEEAIKQGPEPESWEYVWVSTDTLYEW